MSIVYLLVLVLAIGCMVLLDRRFRLFFWRSPWRATAVTALGVIFFVVWDLCGIALDIFSRGETVFMTGIVVAPELPLEELVFLLFLSYLTMILVFGTRRVLDARLGLGRRR